MGSEQQKACETDTPMVETFLACGPRLVVSCYFQYSHHPKCSPRSETQTEKASFIFVLVNLKKLSLTLTMVTLIYLYVSTSS